MRRQIKCLIVGDAAVGKTTFISKLIDGKFDRRYISTNIEEYTIDENITIVEQGGAFKYHVSIDKYKGKIDIVFLFIDLNSSLIQKSIKSWTHVVKVLLGDHIPIKLIETHSDLKQGPHIYEAIDTRHETKHELLIKLYKWCNMTNINRTLLDLSYETLIKNKMLDALDVYPKSVRETLKSKYGE